MRPVQRPVQRPFRPVLLSTLAAGLLVTLAACSPGATSPTTQPAAPSGAVQNVCSTANASLNPAPAKDLTIVALDASGHAIANQSIYAGFYKNDGTYLGLVFGTTDAHGAFAIDTTQHTWLANTPASAFIAVDGTATTPGLATACGNVDGAGTLTVSTGDAGLATVSVTPHSGGTATNTPFVVPAYTFHGKAREVTSLYAGDSRKVRMLDGSYDLGILTTLNSTAYLLYQPVTVSGATTESPDVATAPTTHLHTAIRDAGGKSLTQYGFGMFRADAGLDMRWGMTSGYPDFYLTPGTYAVKGWGELTDSHGASWWYTFDGPHYGVPLSGLDLTHAGTTVDHPFGGALTASLSTDAASYAAGATVTLTPKVTDPSGDTLAVVTEQSSSTSKDVGPTVTVKDPGGTVVYTKALAGSASPSFTLASGAASGTYTASFTWNLGPYQSAAASATATFQVQ